MVMSSDYSSTGPGFYSQHSHSGLKPSVTPSLVNLTPFSVLYGNRHAHNAQTYMQSKHPYTSNKYFKSVDKPLENFYRTSNK